MSETALSKLQSMLNTNVAKATGGNESFKIGGNDAIASGKLTGGRRRRTGKKHHKKHGGNTMKHMGGRRRKSHRRKSHHKKH